MISGDGEARDDGIEGGDAGSAGVDVDIETYANGLLAAAVDATPAWVERAVAGVVTAQQLSVPAEFASAMADAKERATSFVERRLGDLLATDIDHQRSTPLTVFRDAARFPVELLHGLGAAEVHRIDVDRWAFPNDPFAVTPASLADVGDEVHLAGIAWGAAKAHVHLRRRRAEGQR